MTNKNELSEKETDALKEKELEDKKQFNRIYSAVNKMTSSPSKMNTRSAISKFDKDKVSMYLQNPVKYEKQLRQLSNYLYNTSSEYRRIIWYIALMPTYAWKLDPLCLHSGKVDMDRYRKSYFKQLEQIEKMNLRHEMQKAMKVAFRNDVFYGYEYESKDSYFIRHMNPDYCQISSFEEAVYRYKFDFSYFDQSGIDISNEPEEFQNKYQQYKDTKIRWIELDIDKAVCFKVNEDIDEYIPPFSGMFEAIFDLDDYKKLKKNKTETDNFLLLSQKIPMDEKNPELNKFLIDIDTAQVFDAGLQSVTPLGIGVITSPMPIEAIKLEQSKNQNDTVSEAQRELFSSAGVSQFIFNSDKNTSIGLSKSIISDEEISFAMLRQIETWVNRKIRKIAGQYKHNFKILDISRYNESEKQTALKESAQASLPTKIEYAASHGLSPLDFYNNAILENVVLGINEMLVPLASSHTQSDGGRPQAGESKKADSTQVNQDNAED